ncbi:MAG: tetratricopeptide repeat protein [Dysgonomonas sp.]
MKRSNLIILFLVCTLSAFSQKAVRDSLRAGNLAYKNQMYNAAESKYKSAIMLNPAEVMAIYNLGNTYYRQNKWDESIAQYEQYLSVEKNDAKGKSAAYHNMGNALLRKKELEKAGEAYKNALRNNPGDNETRYNLAVVQKMLDDQNKKNKDKDKDKDKNKDKKDKNKDKNDQNQNQNQDPKQNQNQQQPNQQMSSDNIEQILKAMEQEEKATQARVKQAKAGAQKAKNAENKRQNKDW